MSVLQGYSTVSFNLEGKTSLRIFFDETMAQIHPCHSTDGDAWYPEGKGFFLVKDLGVEWRTEHIDARVWVHKPTQVHTQ